LSASDGVDEGVGVYLSKLLVLVFVSLLSSFLMHFFVSGGVLFVSLFGFNKLFHGFFESFLCLLDSMFL